MEIGVHLTRGFAFSTILVAASLLSSPASVIGAEKAGPTVSGGEAGRSKGIPNLAVVNKGDRVRLVLRANRVTGVSKRTVRKVSAKRQGASFPLSHIGGKRWATRWKSSIGLLATLRGRVVATVFVFRNGGRYLAKARVASAPVDPPAPDPPVDPPAPDPPVDPPAGVTVTGLVPEWSEEIPDYTMTCREPVSLTVNVDGPVSLDGGASTSGPLTEQLSLESGQAFRLSGDFGEQVFRCRPPDLPLPAVEGRGSGPLFLVTPTILGTSALTNYAMVLDRNGVPVWWYRAPLPAILDFNMPSPGRFSWVQLRGGVPGGSNSSYTVQLPGGSFIDTIKPVGFGADHHDLQPTPDGGWLLLGYVPRDCPAVPSECEDLSPWGGPPNATVIDGWIQKVDAIGNPVWTWKSQDHIALEESSPWIPALGSGGTLPDGRQAFDIVHLNSVEPDGDGFIFSARHLDAIYRVEDPGGSGAIDWKLGGTPTPENLSVFGDPLGADPLGGQHDARRLADGTVTIHDNGTLRSRPPRMVRYEIDSGAGTAELVSELSDERVTGSICCGGGRVLPDGDGWAVSWGASDVMGEYGLDGEPRMRMTWPDGKHSYRIVPVSPSVLSVGMLRNGMDSQFPRTP